MGQRTRPPPAVGRRGYQLTPPVEGGVGETPFLDIRDRVRSGGERGLLSVAFAPDFRESGYLYSWYTNADVDRVLGSDEGLLDEATRLYANGKNQTDPLISPVYGNYQDFPPAFLITGTRDLLLSNTVRVDMKLLEAGVKTKLVVIEGHSHADYLLVHQAPESQVALNDLNSFLKNYLE